MFWWLTARGRAYHRLVVHQRVVVNLKSGTAIEGVVTERTGPLLVIRQATVHDGRHSAPADGQIVVELGEVDFVQAREEVTS